MSTRRRRALASSVTAILIVPVMLLAGCSAPADDPEDASKLTIFAAQSSGENLAKNSFTAEMEDLSGMEIDWATTTTDSGAAKEARQIALASGDFPEVFMLTPYVDQFSPQELLRYGKQGVLLPLQDLIDEHAPNIKKAFDETPELKKLATAPDGSIYGIPQWNDCFHCTYRSKLWMNTEWLDNLGLEMPKTTDELFDVLMAFKTKDPNGNGKADEIPLSSSVDDLLLPYLVNAFLYDPRGSNTQQSMLALQGDKVVHQATQDAYREALAYVADLAANGLIDEAAFTQNREALKTAGDNAGTVIVGSATMLWPGILTSLGQEDGRDKKYDAVPPLTGPEGVQYTTYTLPSEPGATFALTSAAGEEEQIAAIKILDSFYTDEGHLRAEYGEKDKDWRGPQEGDVALNPDREPLYYPIPGDPDAEPANSTWNFTQYYSDARFRESQIVSEDVYSSEGLERRLWDASLLYSPHVPEDQVFPYWNVWVSGENSAEVADLATNIDAHVTQASAEFVTGTRDIADDGAWQKFLDELDGLGMSRYLEIEQQAYDEIK